RDALGQLGGENEEVVLVGKAVDLVQHQQLKAARVPETTENALDVLVHALHGVDEQHDDIGVESPRPRRLHHRAVEPPARAEDARRIEKDELTGAIDHDAADGDARGLHLAGDDRHLGADKRVDEGRFSSVRRTNDSDETAPLLALWHRARNGFRLSHGMTSSVRPRSDSMHRPARPRASGAYLRRPALPAAWLHLRRGPAF